MTARLKRKAAIMIVVELIFLSLVGVLLTNMQTDLSLNDQRDNIAEKLDEMDELIAAADASGVEITEAFDEENRGKVGSAAFMYQNGVLTGYSRANMQLLTDLLDVDNVIILDKAGRALAQSGDSPADFTRSRFNQLRTVFDDDEPSAAFEVEFGDTCYRYYGARIDESTMVVVEKNAETLYHRLEASATLASALKNVTVGLNGFSFAISAKDYTFLYYPDETIVGQDAISMGLSVASLEDGSFGWMNIGGQRLYGGATLLDDDTYVLCAVTSDEILASRTTTVTIILFAVFVALTLVVTYAFFILRDLREEKSMRIAGKLRFGTSVARKLTSVSLIGLIAILVVSFYMQSIFALSRQSMSNDQRLQEISQRIDQYAAQRDELAAEYDELYLNKAEIAAFIIDTNPELANREKLAELSGILSLESVNVFDQSGEQVATNSPYTRFTVSDDPEDQSYEFNKLLLGVDSLVQEAQPDDVSGDFHQYIGVTLRDEQNNPNGFVQISVIPSRLEVTEENMEIGNILSGIRMGNGGVVFAVNKEDGTIAYHPNSRYIGRDAYAYGITEDAMVDGYTGYVTFAGTRHFASALETDRYIVFAAVPEANIGTARLPVTLVAGAASLVALLVVILMLCLYSRQARQGRAQGQGRKEVRQDHGGRGHAGRLGEEDRGRRQPLAQLLHRLGGQDAGAEAVQRAARPAGRLRGGHVPGGADARSVLRRELRHSSSCSTGKWAHGLNIFAVTGSLLIICVASVVTMIVQRLLTIMARTFGAKGETVCRLLKSLVKYISVIAMLYFCLALLGIDTATLLASAGILTLIVGLGAQTLVSDILAGLFIIFEGEFQVGDIVTVGDWTGTVVEIGVRTTKIQDGNQNIKVISNSNVSGRHQQDARLLLQQRRSGHRVQRIAGARGEHPPEGVPQHPQAPAQHHRRPVLQGRGRAGGQQRHPAHRCAVYRGQPWADGPRPQPRDQAHLRQVRHQHPLPADRRQPAHGHQAGQRVGEGTGAQVYRGTARAVCQHHERGRGRPLGHTTFAPESVTLSGAFLRREHRPARKGRCDSTPAHRKPLRVRKALDSHRHACRGALAKAANGLWAFPTRRIQSNAHKNGGRPAWPSARSFLPYSFQIFSA